MAELSSDETENKTNDNEEENSDSGLQICLNSPKLKKKRKRMEIKPEPEEIKVLAEIENDLEKNLSEKAAKSNLSKVNVKSILKRVFTNEDVLALVRKAEDPKSEFSLPYEPKFTRAKAKELFASHNLTEWIPKSKNVSKTQVLIKEDLPEDTSASDDEYVPAEESEEEPLNPSVDCGTQTIWSSDGVFKLPQSPAPTIEETNIALRTRSKLSLSDTPLEVIEEAFIPPDITTDMYDLDCDDDDWKHFLKQFARPLDEVAKNLEDEEGDPEYNFLADEEVYKHDKEELRADKAVTVTRKELNALIAELFDCADNEPPENNENNQNIEDKIEIKILENLPLLLDDQKLLFEQQMRQHVQLLTQNFLLTYEHHEYQDMANTYKSYLVDLIDLVNNQTLGRYKICNINSALEIIQNWEDNFKTNSTEIDEYRRHVAKVICESQEAKLSGVQYIPTFPNLLLEVISRSEVFLYPNLLPRNPFRPRLSNTKVSFSNSEDNLIAIGLELFYAYVKEHDSKKKLTMKEVCYYINKYCVPVEFSKLYKHVFTSKSSKMSNPIQYYFLNNKAPVTMHYVAPLETFMVLPPCQRDMNQLPAQWRDYLFPIEKITHIIYPVPTITPVSTKVQLPKISQKKVSNENKKSSKAKKQLKLSPIKTNSGNKELIFTPNSSRIQLFSSTPILNSTTYKPDISENVRNLKFNSEIFKQLPKNMMPSMPSLGTPVRCSPEPTPIQEDLMQSTETVNENINKEKDDDCRSTISKVNLDETKVSPRSTLKNVKRKQMFSEKKKARLRRDFQAKLRMLSSEEKDVFHEKTNRFVQAFYDKLQEQLDIHAYHKFMEVLNDFDEHQGSAINLYNSIAEILGNDHPDILDEFLLFFTSHQAKQMKKLIPHQILTNMSLFLRKLELFFKDQPSQVRKIFRALSDLSTNSNVTIAQVKSTILPLLKGNSSLTDWFLRVFMCEKPTESLLNASWENLEVVKESSSSHNDCFETVIVPEMEDPFGGPNCTCTCHNVEDVSYNSRGLHCVPCGTKYMLGKVFVPSRKGLRLARVSFDSDGVDHLSRLSIPKKKNDGNLKQISPSKDSQDGASSDEEPNKKRKVVKSIKKRLPRKKNDQIKTADNKTTKKTSDNKAEVSTHNKCEVTELECCGSVESIEIEDKFQHSCESESECCETSQDNNTDTECSDTEDSNLRNESWTREEDKIILTTFQKEEDEEIAFEKICSVLENRTILEIKERFQVLINFLKKISSNK